jgi:hypothetical protein
MFDQYVASGKRTLAYLGRYREIGARVKAIAQAECKGAHVYAFGSVVTGAYTAASDIDILIVCAGLHTERAVALKARIRRELGLQVPLELHTATPKEFESWYVRFMGEFVEL